MTTFFLFGSYAGGAAEGINPKRTERAEAAIHGCGGKLRSIHALLVGE